MHVKSIWTLRVDTFCRPPVTLMVIPSLSKRLFSERTLKMQILNPPSGYALGILAPLPSEKSGADLRRHFRLTLRGRSAPPGNPALENRTNLAPNHVGQVHREQQQLRLDRVPVFTRAVRKIVRHRIDEERRRQ